MATGVQVWSTTASANSTADTNVNWAEGMAPSQENDSARAEMASVAKWRDDNNGTIVTSGTTAAYTVTSNQVEAALTAGYTIAFTPHASNDSAATLAVDGLAAKPLQVVNGTNLQGGELIGGNIYRATYSTSGTGQWIIQNVVSPGSQANIVNTVNLTDGAVTYAKIQTPGASKLLGNPSTSTSTNYREITLGTNLTFSGTTLNAANNTPVVTVITSTATATWQSTTQNGAFPLYVRVRMVGGGGGGAALSSNNGSVGKDTSFDSWTAIHGQGGVASTSNGGLGGTGGADGTGISITRISGARGNGGNSGGGGSPAGGMGGVSFFGGAGSGNVSGAGTNASTNSGSGGGGAGTGSGSGSGGGGAGEYVEFMITTPSTSYAIQVGAGGAGGPAGGSAGGDGAAGRIEVIAYWQ